MSAFDMYPTLVTPFTAAGAIDFDSLGRLIALFARAKCEGVFAVCQSSEMFFLSDEEKLALAGASIAFCRQNGIQCIVSGHAQDRADRQLDYLKKLEKLRPDAIILVNNRLAAENESEDTALKRLEVILKALEKDTRLGVYECPYPYKRALSPALLRAMIADGRFTMIKDTCCKIDEIKARLDILKGSGIRLFNANAATLFESMEAGAAGYSGVQLNLMPKTFALLRRAYNAGESTRAAQICRYLSFSSVLECQNYPTNAKYCLQKSGIFRTTVTRNGKPALTESQQKELDAFLACDLYAYYHLMPRVPTQLLFRYDAAFPECHASTVLPLENGRVLVAYFAGSYEKADDVGIWLSVRERESWRAPRRVAKIRDCAHWNPVLYAVPGGVRLHFKVGKSIDVWESYAMFSSDGGETWTAPAPMDAENRAGGPVRGKPLRLSDGRLLAGKSDEMNGMWSPRIDESTDDGAGYHRLADIIIERENRQSPDFMPGMGAIQPALWESESGVHALMRTDCGQIYRSDSADGGRTWRRAYPTALPSNNSAIDVEKVGDTLYLALNPIGRAWGPRTPLVLMTSQNDGETFEDFAVLADELADDAHDGYSQFAYPALAARDGQLYVSFTHQRKSVAFCQINLSKV